MWAKNSQSEGISTYSPGVTAKTPAKGGTMAIATATMAIESQYAGKMRAARRRAYAPIEPNSPVAAIGRKRTKPLTANRTVTPSGRIRDASPRNVPAIATADLSGGTVVETVSRGKHLLTRIDSRDTRWTLHTHLKMEGSWRVYDRGQRWSKAGHLARVVLHTRERTAVGFQLGIVELVLREHEDKIVGHLGPDLLGPDWDPDEAVRRLTADPDRPVGEALLDQRNLAGIGTIYRTELCFLTGYDPRTPVGR